MGAERGRRVVQQGKTDCDLAGCEPSAGLTAAAAAELQAVGYLPLGLVLGLIIVGVGAYFVAVLRAEEPSAA